MQPSALFIILSNFVTSFVRSNCPMFAKGAVAYASSKLLLKRIKYARYTHASLDATDKYLLNFDEGKYGNNTGAGNVIYTLELDDIEKIAAEKRSGMEKSGMDVSVFGRRYNRALESIVGNVNQTFGNEFLYPTVKAQASYLIYALVKNHPFIDGNKRMAASVFTYFVERNKYAIDADGHFKVPAKQLAFVVMMIARSTDANKDSVISDIELMLELEELE